MSKVTRYLLIVFAVVLMASSAGAAELSLVGAGTFSNQALSAGGDSLSAKFGAGGGALLDAFFTPMTSLEIGGLYVNKKFDDTTSQFALSYNYLQVPVLFRVWFTRMFSVGAGGFWEHGMGTPTATPDAGGTALNTGFARANDAGLEGSVGFRFRLGPGVKLLVDGRYLRGLTNLAGGGATEYWSDIQALAGLSFSFGNH